MTELQIYTLDSNKNLVATLAIGEHSFGRGTLLKCDDKRVSRNHGVIKVEPSNVTITSVHQNPCFYQAANSSTITILPKDSSVKIQDCDKFALLADSYWYEVKIKFAESLKLIPSNESEDSNDSIDFLQLADKRKGDDLEPVSPKRVKYTDDRETELLSPGGNRNSEESNNSIDFLEMYNTFGGTVAESNEKPIETSENVLKEVISESEEKVDESNGKPIENAVINKEVISESEEEVDESNGKPIENAVINKEVISESEEEVSDNCTASNTDSKTKSKKDEDQNSQNKFKADLKAMLFSSDEEDESVQTPIASNSNNESLNGNVTKDNSKKEDDVSNQNSNTAGTSGTVNRQWRDRCWYGAGCYRKSRQHLTEYSHPGDSDYESDSNDTRPLCVHGDNCYRQNKEHRRDYRHSKNNQAALNKKPTTKDTKKRRTAPKTYAESSDDDYDLQDPFINNNSGSDFAVDSVSDDTTASDVSEECEEETKRLLKEAKRFQKQNKD